MQHVNLQSIYQLATGVHGIGKFKVGTSLSSVIGHITGTHWLLGHLLEGRPVPLSRCIPFAKIVDEQITGLMDKFSVNPLYVLTDDDCDKLYYAVNAFEQYFAREVDRFDVFYIPPKGTHATIKLIEKADENIPPDVRSRLSKEATNDIQQAGRCLALDSPTAAGFHILRAVESLIRFYVDKVTGKPHPAKNRNWGAYIKAIRDNNADARVANYLQHVKDTYRNPIMHPEIVLTPDEAFSLFNASLSAIVQLDAAIQAWP